jgi:hypothetical protein
MSPAHAILTPQPKIGGCPQSVGTRFSTMELDARLRPIPARLAPFLVVSPEPGRRCHMMCRRQARVSGDGASES